MQFEEIKEKVNAYQRLELKLFSTSSFQTHSLVLLHIISRIDKRIPIFFINTGYHFPETISFKDRIAKLFELNVRDVFPLTPKSMQKDSHGRLMFASDPDYCCFMNKTQPMEPILAANDVWINGVRADQSNVRKNFKVETPAPFNTIRFHPMLDWSPKMIHDYLSQHNIPHHPMEEKGYFSIGCEPCTRGIDMNADTREGRWFGLKKTECGLNTDLAGR
ncbi:MAG TPA: phosphoadenylyl-sulfate reductase [Chitinophagales bacterium]|nr:phosphoadenylyl-sulfate reductase [Chitinophagales bacterium]